MIARVIMAKAFQYEAIIMDYHYFKDIVNNIFAKAIDAEKRPTFFNISEIYPALNEITANFNLIKAEFEYAYKKVNGLPKYHEVDPGEAEISNTTAKNWNVFMLYLLGYKPQNNRSLCPETCKLLEKIPNLVQAFFSILEPGKSVPKHKGPYLGYLRYHLGIHVPSNNPPYIIVNDQPYTWKEGEAVMFDDSWPHEVVNNCSDFRAVLIIDVLRPMPIWPQMLNRFITNVVAKYTYGRSVIKRVGQF